ncbi:hypothetical protein NPX13_g11469 [Xylaria arbuscula]|uniref:Uncharacterized protein n=1 Tax=Xylaria arbuscula TaxID=114810 RepID=A0A9W8N2S3_9PEZI|nr:hypothetical protein NPX13_g11469 [Xylaria arbuscula]
MESAVSMASNSEAMRHSIKLADPAKLSDGQDPTFERWKNSTQRKLRTNWWLFPSEESKFDWLCTLVDGEAAVMLEPFICEDNAEPLTTVEEVYELLRSSYSNPDAVAEARDELYHLWMKDTEDFYSFCSKWVLLASKAGLARMFEPRPAVGGGRTSEEAATRVFKSYISPPLCSGDQVPGDRQSLPYQSAFLPENRLNAVASERSSWHCERSSICSP